MALSLSKKGQVGLEQRALPHYEMLELREFERATDEAVAVKSVLGAPISELGELDEVEVPLVIVGYDQGKIGKILLEQRQSYRALRPIAVIGLPAEPINQDILQLADVVLPPRPPQALLADTASTLATLASHVQRLQRAPSDRMLTLLQFLYTRGRDVDAVVDATSALAYRFPLAEVLLLESTLSSRELLEDLAARSILDQRHVDRMFTCPDCNSYQVPVKELCPQCHSSHIQTEESIHHFQCGYVAPESEFTSTGSHQCPKCFKALRHIGVEYNRPGLFSVCHECNHWATEPELMGWCAHCDQYHPPSALLPVEIKRYALSQVAADIARRGRWSPREVSAEMTPSLPAGEAPTSSAKSPASDHDYAKALALRVVELAQQGGRPMTVYRAVLDDRDHNHDAEPLLAKVRDILRGILRDSDVVVAAGDNEFLLLLPAHDQHPTPAPDELVMFVRQQGGVDMTVSTIVGAMTGPATAQV